MSNYQNGKWGLKAELDSIKPKEIYKNQKIKKKSLWVRIKKGAQ